ncbi:hypothetical protein D3C76_1830180 [compost metagenome]
MRVAGSPAIHFPKRGFRTAIRFSIKTVAPIMIMEIMKYMNLILILNARFPAMVPIVMDAI